MTSQVKTTLTVDTSAKGRAARVALQATRGRLLVKHPFYGTLMFNLIIVVTNDIPTAAVDGRHLFVNAEFFMGLDEDEQVGLLVHEVLHCALQHHTRLQKHDPLIWNIACDMVVNSIVTSDQLKLPDGALFPKDAWLYMNAEQIYQELLKDANVTLTGSIGDKADLHEPGSVDVVGDPTTGLSKSEQETERAAIEEAAPENSDENTAAWTQLPCNQNTKNPGHGVNAVKRVITNMATTPVSRSEYIQEFVDNAARGATSFSNINRRLFASGVYAPGPIHDSLTSAVCVIDTSGSMERSLLSKIQDDIDNILEEGLVQRVVVLQVDTRVRDEATYFAGDSIPRDIVGRGGTSFAEAFEHIRERHHEAVCVIYYTDLQTTSWGEDPGLPVLWITDGDVSTRVPFGRVIAQ